MRFKVVRCPKCGAIQPTSAAKVLKCKRCSKSSQLSKSIVFAEAENAQKASEIARKLKLLEAKKQ